MKGNRDNLIMLQYDIVLSGLFSPLYVKCKGSDLKKMSLGYDLKVLEDTAQQNVGIKHGVTGLCQNIWKTAKMASPRANYA